MPKPKTKPEPKTESAVYAEILADCRTISRRLDQILKATLAQQVSPPQPPALPASAIEEAASPLALSVVKGDIVPLTAPQRELVSIFIEHLRSLPILAEDDEWDAEGHQIIYDILFQYFERRYGHLETGSDLWDESLSEEDTDKFHRLMWDAGSPRDPRIDRQNKILGLEPQRKTLLESIERYQRDRRKLGLRTDDSIEVCGKFTSLERSAELTWGNSDPGA